MPESMTPTITFRAGARAPVGRRADAQRVGARGGHAGVEALRLRARGFDRHDLGQRRHRGEPGRRDVDGGDVAHDRAHDGALRLHRVEVAFEAQDRLDQWLRPCRARRASARTSDRAVRGDAGERGVELVGLHGGHRVRAGRDDQEACGQACCKQTCRRTNRFHHAESPDFVGVTLGAGAFAASAVAECLVTPRREQNRAHPRNFVLRRTSGSKATMVAGTCLRLARYEVQDRHFVVLEGGTGDARRTPSGSKPSRHEGAADTPNEVGKDRQDGGFVVREYAFEDHRGPRWGCRPPIPRCPVVDASARISAIRSALPSKPMPGSSGRVDVAVHDLHAVGEAAVGLEQVGVGLVAAQAQAGRDGQRHLVAAVRDAARAATSRVPSACPACAGTRPGRS